MATKTKPTAEDLVRAYRRIRDAIKEKEDEVKGLKAEQDVISEALLELCADQGADSIKTPAGTISRRLNTRYWTSDWESMYSFIKEHDAFYLLEKRISQNNLREYLDENPDTLPVGLNSDKAYVVHVRKPSGGE